MGTLGLKLLYLSQDYTTHDRRFLQSFVAAKCEVSYVRLERSNFVFERRAVPAGVAEIEWKSGLCSVRTLRETAECHLSLGRILKNQRPDIVLAGPIQTGATFVALHGYRPLVAMSWGSDLLVDADRNAWSRLMTKFTLRCSSGVLGDCQAVREKVHTLLPYSDNRIVTFPWGIDLHDFRPGPSGLTLRADLGWDKKLVLISTRTWEPRYAIDVLVRAFVRVNREYPDTRLLLLGDGSQEPRIRQLIDEFGLQSMIHAPGRIDYRLLSDYFRLSDVYVSSALSDGTSISLVEAMACGLAVVVTNSYGNIEWVNPGKNGWLAEPGNSDSLARALMEALADRERLRKMGEANVVVARQRADWTRNFPSLLELFGRVCAT